MIWALPAPTVPVPFALDFHALEDMLYACQRGSQSEGAMLQVGDGALKFEKYVRGIISVVKTGAVYVIVAEERGTAGEFVTLG